MEAGSLWASVFCLRDLPNPHASHHVREQATEHCWQVGAHRQATALLTTGLSDCSPGECVDCLAPVQARVSWHTQALWALL